ncbi:uncharacterized protein RHOBADRAFT_54472 [Rhodotorula graminis WP1]|uniref:F-box domain-containing protein n=1 Tax=Rhodotorula graminis (strain WP1) TaxID=578459 RepID=A0A0P9EP00_RHOGW|nr:uncharacterized protein RHOBADRAFT_54472 [Rhodotorula graminis WP1]KPV73881.1 hypothetical protein RHOBADRAFT_54472 [Rhodotorula graminis WP1]
MPPRRSARAKSRKAVPAEVPSPTASLADESDVDDPDRAGSSSPRGGSKKARTTKGKGKQTPVDASDTESPPKKRKTQPGPPRAPKHKPVFSIDLLLKLPFDLVAEICSHLNGGELLQLSRTCKTLREFLYGPQSSSIWAASRQRRGLVLPEDMTEQQLADLLHRTTCVICEGDWAYATVYYLRTFLCWTCEKIKFIQGSKIRNGLQGLHPQARQCVRYDPGRLDQPKAKYTYVIHELWAESAKLYELAEQDEAVAHAHGASRSKKSKRAKGASSDVPGADSLAKYVKEKEEWVERGQAVSQSLHDAIQAELRARQQLIEDENKRKSDEQQAKIADFHRNLRNEHDWTEAETTWLGARLYHLQAPRTVPDVDPAGWAAFRILVKSQIAREATATAARLAFETRRDAIKPYYDSFKAAQPGLVSRVVPEFAFFLDWSAVKPLWQPVEAAPVSDAIWARALPAIRKNFDDYQEELRVEAIRAILWATTRTAPASRDPADYPESTYDQDWFERPTAMFWGESHANLSISFPRPFPDTLWDHQAVGCRKEWLRKHIGDHDVAIMRVILDAVGCKEASTKWWHLGGFDLRWVDSPYKQAKERNRRYNYVELLYALKRRGPKAYQLASRTMVPQIEVWQDEEDDSLEGCELEDFDGSEECG